MRGLRDAAAVKATLESALGATDAPEGAKRRYSVTDLRAFQANRELVAESRAKLGKDAAVARQLAEAAAMITCGCHTFHKRDKVGYLPRAREHTCYAFTTLLLSEDEAAPELGGDRGHPPARPRRDDPALRGAADEGGAAVRTTDGLVPWPETPTTAFPSASASDSQRGSSARPTTSSRR